MTSPSGNEERTAMDIISGLDPLVKLGAVLVGVLVFLFRTFATKEALVELRAYVNIRHREAIEHSDKNTQQVIAMLGEIRDMLKTIEARTWDMKGRDS